MPPAWSFGNQNITYHAKGIAVQISGDATNIIG